MLNIAAHRRGCVRKWPRYSNGQTIRTLLGVAQEWRDLAEQADRERHEHRSNKAA
jgi:hypothetical protein